MSNRSGLAVHFGARFALCCLVLPLASGLQAQKASRLPATARSEKPFSSPDPNMLMIQTQPATPLVPVPPARTVSVGELLIPARAVKEFQRSLKAIQSNDFPDAVGHLQKALAIAPKFPQAHNNLGAVYLQRNDYESAVAQFHEAIALDGNSQEAHRNLSVGLFCLRRYPEAEAAARRALELGPKRTASFYTLGRILAAEGSQSPEAEALLRQSVTDFPDARLALARVLVSKGDRQEAAAELRTYLDSPNSTRSGLHAARCALAQITQTRTDTACDGDKTAR
jgi:Flp pilus assembly protein TadD